MALVDLANNAAYKIGGWGDQLDGSGLITAAQLTANTDRVSQAINTKYPVVRKQIYSDFAKMGTPFKESSKFADLGDDLKQDDVAISTIVSVAGVVTFTTSEVHDLSVSDTRFFADIKGTLVISLNGTTKTVATVPSTTTFTLTGVTGTSDWDHTENTGIVSKAPEMAAWLYAFNMPSDYHALVRQTDVSYTSKEGHQQKYQCDAVPNIDDDGILLLTNHLTNLGVDSAYIQYVFDQTNFAVFSSDLDECLAMKLAYELAAFLGRDLNTRQTILVEYDNITVPKAQAFNQSQMNSYSKIIPDFSGGRSRGIVPGRVFSDLGTFVDAQGNRRSVQ